MAQNKGIDNSLSPGTILHSKTYVYRIEKVLGQGSFGITYLTKVEWLNSQRVKNHSFHVTIKEFFMKDINSREGTTVTAVTKGGICEKYKSKFAQEAKNLQKLEHPNIVCVIDFFAENNTYYYAMDYLCGGSLDRLIMKESAVLEPKALRYIRQIGSALVYMHSNKMLHLDLKPANVMLNADDEAVVIDFGLSKQYDENGEPESSTTVGGGTPGYAPLEQSSFHDGHGFPVTMDIYALGATLYKLLVGKRSPDASAILNDGFPFDKLEEHHVSKKIVTAISKAMSPMKKDRYQSVDDFLDDIATVDADTDDDEMTLDINDGDMTLDINDGDKALDINRRSRKKKIAKRKLTLSDIIEAADNAYSRKDYPTALSHYLEAFRRDSSLGEIAYTIAEIYYKGRDHVGNEKLSIYYRKKNSSVWFQKAYDLGIDTSKELLDKAKSYYVKKDYKNYIKTLDECILKNYRCKDPIFLLIEAYEKGIGCDPDRVEWETYHLREKLKEIDDNKDGEQNTLTLQEEERKAVVDNPLPSPGIKFSSGCIRGLLIYIFAILIVGAFALYNSRTSDDIFDPNIYEEIGYSGRLKDEYITSFFKVYNPKSQLWGVVSVGHKKGEHPHPNTDNLVLPIEYDSVYVDKNVDIHDNWNSTITVCGYKNGQLYNNDGTVVDNKEILK